MKFKYPMMTKKEHDSLVKAWNEYKGNVPPDFQGFHPDFEEIESRFRQLTRNEGRYSSNTILCNLIYLRKKGGRVYVKGEKGKPNGG